MTKTVPIGLLVVLIACSSFADDDTENAPDPNGRDARNNERPYRLDSASDSPAVAVPRSLATPFMKDAAERRTELRFKVIMADVAPENWAQVEETVGSLKSPGKQPPMNDAIIEKLKSRELITVITRPLLGMNSGGNASLSFDRADIGLSDAHPEFYKLEFSGKEEGTNVRMNVKVTISYGNGEMSRRRIFDAGFKVKPGEFVALAMPGIDTDESDDEQPLGKVIFLSPSIVRRRVASARIERDSPLR